LARSAPPAAVGRPRHPRRVGRAESAPPAAPGPPGAEPAPSAAPGRPHRAKFPPTGRWA